MAQITIAQDTCIRANQTGLGTASDGETYSQPIGTSALSIVSNKIQVTGPATSNNFLLLGSGQIVNGDLKARFSMSSLSDFAGFVIHYVDVSNWMRVEIQNGAVRIRKSVSGALTLLSPTGTTTIVANTNYQMHVNMSGTTFSVRVWPDGTSEPSTWNIQVTDSSLGLGKYGLFANLASASDIVLFDQVLITATPTTYYVATTGSDSNPGTQSQPFATIQKSLLVVQAGDSVQVGAGTYRPDNSTSFMNMTNGTPLAHIQYSSTVKWAAKLIQPVVLYSHGQIWSSYGNYTDIIGFEVSGNADFGIIHYGSYGSVQSCYVHDILCPDFSIPLGLGGAGIASDTPPTTNVSVFNNIVVNVGPPGVPNLLCQGIYISAHNCSIYNNIVFKCSSWGIHLWHNCSGSQIFNNLSAENGCGGYMVGSDLETITNVTVANNIAANNHITSVSGSGYGFNETLFGVGAFGTGNNYTNNCAFGNDAGAFRPWASDATLFYYSHLPFSNSQLGNPQFINYQVNGSGDYHLLANSPCINAGVSTGAPATDYSNAFRSLKGTIDIGPYLFFHSALFPATSRRSGVFPTTARRTGVFPTTNRRGT